MKKIIPKAKDLQDEIKTGDRVLNIFPSLNKLLDGLVKEHPETSALKKIFAARLFDFAMNITFPKKKKRNKK